MEDITTGIPGITIEIIAVAEGLTLTATVAVADPEADTSEGVTGIIGIGDTIGAARGTEAGRTVEAGTVTPTTPP